MDEVMRNAQILVKRDKFPFIRMRWNETYAFCQDLQNTLFHAIREARKSRCSKAFYAFYMCKKR